MENNSVIKGLNLGVGNNVLPRRWVLRGGGGGGGGGGVIKIKELRNAEVIYSVPVTCFYAPTTPPPPPPPPQIQLLCCSVTNSSLKNYDVHMGE